MSDLRWIFGYGSLMWHPGFAYVQRRTARLRGYHREFCMVSTRNRGTEQAPGLVLSVCPGGELVGSAFAYDPAGEPDVFRYLDEREGLHRAHERCIVPIEFADGPPPHTIPCWTYLPVLTAPNFHATMPLERRAELVAQGCGKIGTSYDYLERLLGELTRLNVSDPGLQALYDASRRLCAEGPAGGK